MKIVIDVLTPKQVMFFPKIAQRLIERGHEVWLTSRRYREVNMLLDKLKIETTIVGEHGGKELEAKLKSSIERIKELIPLFKRIKPDVTISLSSPEMARVSFGLGIPHFCFNDSPHAKAVAKLTIPLSYKLLTPSIIPVSSWKFVGIDEKKIIVYNALDPWVWLKNFKPDQKILDELDLIKEKPLVTLRMPETQAAYLLKNSQDTTAIIDFSNDLVSKEGFQMVIIPRYQEQCDYLMKRINKEIKICETIVDGPSLLFYSDVFVGAGGTMTAEAALLGVPTISCYPGKPYLIERYLLNKGLIERETDFKKISSRIRDILYDDKLRKKQKEKAKRLVKSYEDPVDVIIKEVENY